MAREVVVSAEKIKRRKKAYLTAKIVLLCLLLLLFIVFIILNFIFNVNRFTISLDRDLERDKGIVIYEDLEERAPQRKLYAETIGNMDNISALWLPKDIHSSALGGSHNGDNYIAYTFYIENQGEVTVNYWYQIVIDDVIKGVDEAIRVKVYLNDLESTYAKVNRDTGEAEEDTIPFYDDENVLLQERSDFKKGDIDKFTIVIFLEGDDPDCLNNIIGGEIKMHMEIREEHIDKEENDE